MTAMRIFTFSVAICLSVAFGQTGRYLYISTPDGAQTQGRSGTGILISYPFPGMIAPFACLYIGSSYEL